MNMFTLKNVALGIALTATAISAKAQKVYTEGSLNYSINANGMDVAAKCYFKPDTSSIEFAQGPATIKMIGTAKNDYFAVLVSVPVASMKKAAIATPGEIEEAGDFEPSYAFTATTETKKIGDYNCIKYTAKDTKSGSSYDLWLTSDIKVPANSMTKAFATLPGTPVLFTYLRTMAGKSYPQTVTLTSISDAKVPAGTFSIPADYDKISLTDLQSMGGRKQ